MLKTRKTRTEKVIKKKHDTRWLHAVLPVSDDSVSSFFYFVYISISIVNFYIRAGLEKKIKILLEVIVDAGNRKDWRNDVDRWGWQRVRNSQITTHNTNFRAVFIFIGNSSKISGK